ncbi:class I SAM-dependent DNA methyltransferase [Xanthomonas cerealis]|uniref:class I SAM-dependent DNA methyltransferase n=1 Tax=Xanthomonas cerealis TaxID=3390025 RepID=UPI00057900AC|nr:class I SAM-dependent methyltransferase [Xanthomonas translucens]UKE46292.1 class I SAM-dependent methyltransferase [Xanthomonas translucens pv. cerealis]UKE68587.1 class I SAM-dependent methyltransferase [Xanthomonas translucens pv. pistacia]
MSSVQEYFGAIYRHDDPFGYRERWYEARKRALLLASLPRARFERGWELGCSNGELTAALAPRCDALLATDLSERAVVLAAQRNAQSAHVLVQQAEHPRSWPPGRFDLIVFSEVGYYLPLPLLQDCIQRLRASLTEHGVLVACHWLHPFVQACMDGGAVHACLAQTLQLPRLLRYEDDDMLLEAWSATPYSVAAVERLR